ncbi:MAG: efflux RND transporter periplasmic adaptor subunit [Rubrivivax sp.]|nr:efflux RND transporter periplasmic adaptor subunit [Rubrivivax sp.]
MNRKTIGIAAAVATVVLAALAARWVLAPKPIATPVAAASEAATQGIQLAAGDITVAAHAELRTTLAVTGSLKAVSSAIVKARVAGEVKSLLVREGDRVSAGQLIGQLDSTEYQLRLRQAEDQARAAQAQLDIAQRTLDNNKALVDQGFISRNALDTSVSSAAGANASLQAARAAAEIARKAVRDSEVRAPIAGLVAQRLVQPGERVNLDARIVEIVDLSRLELEAAVAPEDVVQLRVGQTALVQIDGLAAAVTARVVRINPSAQTGTRAVLAYLELAPGASAAGLRQGLFARGSIELQRKSALVVPATALRLDQSRPYLLTVGDGLAKATGVSTGSRGDVLIDGQLEAGIEITAGLEAGTPVLRGTVGTLREGTRLTLPGAGGGAPTGPAAAAVVAAPAAPSPPATPR